MREHFANAGPANGRGHGTAESSGATALVRGTARLFAAMGYRVLAELPLGNGRRADVIAVGREGRIAIVEVKSSLADFRADGKWREYVPYCDEFYFAVAVDFPRSVLPLEVGVIIADAYQGAIVREAPLRPIRPARRKALLLRFGRTAAARLQALLDPHAGAKRAR